MGATRAGGLEASGRKRWGGPPAQARDVTQTPRGKRFALQCLVWLGCPWHLGSSRGLEGRGAPGFRAHNAEQWGRVPDLVSCGNICLGSWEPGAAYKL